MTDRFHQSLDGQWQFFLDPMASLNVASLQKTTGIQIQVPAPWQSQSADLQHYTGVAWYRRSVNIPSNWLEKNIVLHFGAVDYKTVVWFNDEKVGEHEGGYLPFDLDVTRFSHEGTNTITLRVEDGLKLFPEVPHGKQSWYGQISGIWQSVYIEACPALFIKTVKVTPNENQVRVKVELNRQLEPNELLRYEILSPNGETVFYKDSNKVEELIAESNPLLWDLATPNLYTARISTNLPEEDIWEQKFGFRSIKTMDGKILLNGKPIYLRAALDQDYYPDLIYTPPSLEFIEDQFRKAKEMGLNCLRIHIKVGDPRYYEVADRFGMLIWTELPSWQILSEESSQRGLETLRGMVERDWNHPSIVIWTIINESWGIDLSNPDHRAWLANAYHFLKELDPNRLIVGNSACSGNSQVITDILDFHNYYAIPDHKDKWETWVRSFANRPEWAYARPYDTYSEWKSFIQNPWKKNSDMRFADEVQIKGDEPLIVSEFGNWGLPEVNKLTAHYGGEPWWFETGFDWGEGIVYPHGVENRFKAFHLDRAFPSIRDFCLATQSYQFNALKYQIERMRLEGSINGYVITEFTDVQWESNGLLDMCRNPKAFFPRLKEINSDDMLIPDYQRVAYWEGEKCSVKLYLSHYSKADLSNSRVEWNLAGYGNEFRGNLSVQSVGDYDVSQVGKIEFIVPNVDLSARARLEFRLISEDGLILANNELNLTFFPHEAQLSHSGNALSLYAPDLPQAAKLLGFSQAGNLAEADVALVTTLTDDLREFLLAGGRVLWLAEQNDTQQTFLGPISIQQRQGTIWQGDWVNTFSWISPNPLFKTLPDHGLLDFNFSELTPENVILGLGQDAFAHMVYAAMTVGWIHRTVALAAKVRVGKGELFISTFRLSQNMGSHPVAAGMVKDMISDLSQGIIKKK